MGATGNITSRAARTEVDASSRLRYFVLCVWFVGTPAQECEHGTTDAQERDCRCVDGRRCCAWSGRTLYIIYNIDCMYTNFRHDLHPLTRIIR